jgi:hypothetical protein
MRKTPSSAKSAESKSEPNNPRNDAACRRPLVDNVQQLRRKNQMTSPGGFCLGVATSSWISQLRFGLLAFALLRRGTPLRYGIRR